MLLQVATAAVKRFYLFFALFLNPQSNSFAVKSKQFCLLLKPVTTPASLLPLRLQLNARQLPAALV